MSESKFTPGPWSVPHFASDGPCDCAYIFSDSQRGFGSVATVSWHSEEQESRETCIANACLIAAAPELLEALSELVKVNVEHNEAIARITGAPTGWKDSYLDAARAAIAKATASPMGKE
jgi:hypothetical protein